MPIQWSETIMKNQQHSICIAFFIFFLPFILFTSSFAQQQFSIKTAYFEIRINKNTGYITSMKNITRSPAVELAVADKPSPLLCLYNYQKKQYYFPQSASVHLSKDTLISLKYKNGSTAIVKVNTYRKYFKFTLQSLSPRSDVTDIQWGSYHTAIKNLFGEIIGVARDTSSAVNYAIGALALNDQTTGGFASTVGDAAPFEYIVHSPDPSRFPLPADLHESQVFPIGGDGISDVAFYSRPELYFRILYGNTAMVDSSGSISIQYHAVDRRKPRDILFSLIPHMETNKPNHQHVQALPGVDFIGSSIALWGSPDSIALMHVIKDIVLHEHLPYHTVNGKWIKDPAAYVNDVSTSGGLYDSTISYVKQLGFKAIQLEDQPYFRPDRGDNGYIDGKDFSVKPLRLSSGNLSQKAFSDLSNAKGIWIGRHTVTQSLANGTKDVSPVPGDSLLYLQQRILEKNISATDTNIVVNDNRYLEEISSWEGHAPSLNMIKIGKELIHYLGVSHTAPYTLLHVTRGYWNTKAVAHVKGETIYKLQPTLEYGYEGLQPNMYLQDEIAKYYAEVSRINGIYYIDWDGQEWFFNQGHGYYAVKRFHRILFEKAAAAGIPDVRIMGATLSEGSWHYQSVYNVGGGTNMYFTDKRQWNIQGKDVRAVTFSNYFPATFGINFDISAHSDVQMYENIMALSVGVGATFMLNINQKNIEACPKKYDIFKALKTWENARAANAFSFETKKMLAYGTCDFYGEIKKLKNYHLKEIDSNTWQLFEVTDTGLVLLDTLKRDPAYQKQ